MARKGESRLNGQYSPAPGRRSALGSRRHAGLHLTAVAAGPDSRTLKTLGQLSTVGLAFVFALVMGFGAGLWLDRRLDTAPWLSLLGFGMGLAAGILNVVRTMRSVTEAGREDSPGPPSAGS